MEIFQCPRLRNSEQKGLTSIRNETTKKKVMLHICKGNLIQMMITKLTKKCLWVYFGINER